MNSTPTASNKPTGARRWGFLQWLFLTAGLLLLGFLVRRVGLQNLWVHVLRMGWTFLGVVLMYAGLHVLRTLSWKICLAELSARLPLPEALRVWLAGEAVANLSFGWSGDAFRTALPHKRIPPGRGLSALLLSRLAYTYASLLVTMLGVAAGLWIFPQGPLRTYATGGAGILIFFVLAPVFWGVRTFRFLRAWNDRLAQRPPGTLLGRAHRFLRQMGDQLIALFSSERRVVLELLLVNFAAAFIGVLEIYLLLHALEPSTTLGTALVVEAGSKLISLLAYVIPGNVGVREGGIMLLLQPFGYEPSVGVALALVRRARVLVWVAVGSCLMMFLGFDRTSLTGPRSD